MPKSPSKKKPSRKTTASPGTETIAVDPKPRKLKPKRTKLDRVMRRHTREVSILPPAAYVVRQSAQLLWRNKKLFGGVLLIYAILQLVLVQGILGSDFSGVNSAIKNAYHNQWHGLAGGLTLFSYLVGSTGQADTAESSVYQSLLLLIASLAVIWALRQVLAGHAIRIRDAYYKGMYPLVPFLLVLLVIGLQTLPMAIGAWLYSMVAGNGIAVTGVEKVFWIFIFVLSIAISVYLICSSLFALYIVTLPDMTPLKALRSARGLVRYRRFSIIRKLLFVAVIILLVLIVVMLPVIIFVSVAAPYVFYVLTVLMVGFVHTYIYSLYRELLVNE